MKFSFSWLILLFTVMLSGCLDSHLHDMVIDPYPLESSFHGRNGLTLRKYQINLSAEAIRLEELGEATIEDLWRESCRLHLEWPYFWWFDIDDEPLIFGVGDDYGLFDTGVIREIKLWSDGTVVEKWKYNQNEFAGDPRQKAIFFIRASEEMKLSEVFKFINRIVRKEEYPRQCVFLIPMGQRFRFFSD